MEWKEIFFDDFCRLNRGFDLPNDKVVEGDVPVVASSSVKAFHNVAKVKGPGVVTGRSGTLGVVQYIEKDFWPLNTSLYVKDFKGNSPRFCYYFLQMMHLENFNAGAGVPTLNQNHLHKLKIKVPSTCEEQEKVASILSNYDTLIDINAKRIKLLEDSARDLYKEWFVRMRFPGYEQTKFVKGIPEGWKIEKASSVIDIMNGGTPKTEHEEYYGGDIPFYTPKDANDSIFAYSTLTCITDKGLVNCNSQFYPVNTLMITARGTVGKLNLLAVPMAMNQSCFALRFKTKRDPYYLYFSIEQEIAKLKKMANGGVFDTIVVKTFDNIKVIIPGESVLEQFNKHANPLFEQIKTLQLQNQSLTATRDRLLPRLLSGELKINA